MRKMDYFGTFLSTLNSDAPASGARPGKAPSSSAATSGSSEAGGVFDADIESMLRLLPTEPGAEASIVDLSRRRGFSLNQTASVLRTAESMGLVHNNSGRFSLTGLGLEAMGQAG
jgi:hypothetical protein